MQAHSIHISVFLNLLESVARYFCHVCILSAQVWGVAIFREFACTTLEAPPLTSMAGQLTQHQHKMASYRFFKGLQVADENLRSAALENVLDRLGALLPEPSASAAAHVDTHDHLHQEESASLESVFPAVLRVVQEWYASSVLQSLLFARSSLQPFPRCFGIIASFR